MSADHSDGTDLSGGSVPCTAIPRPDPFHCECSGWVLTSLDRGADGHHPTCTARAEQQARRGLAAAEQTIDLGAAVRAERAEAEQPATKALDLDAIEARANAAECGPWSVEHRSVVSETAVIVEDGASCGWENYPDTIAFIAHARQDVPRLVARVRELEHALSLARGDEQWRIDEHRALKAIIRPLVAKSVEMERERCARVCENQAQMLDAAGEHFDADGARLCAKVLRALTPPAEPSNG